MYYHRNIELIRKALSEKKCLNLKNVHFEKKGSKGKEIQFLHFMAALTTWAKRVAKQILETRNTSYVSMQV